MRGVTSDRGVLVEEPLRGRVAWVGLLDLELVERELHSGVDAGNHRDGADDLVADPEVGADDELVRRFRRARNAMNAGCPTPESRQLAGRFDPREGPYGLLLGSLGKGRL